MRDLKTIILILLLCAAGLVLLMPHSEAYERITQGSIVYINETYDISGVTGWAESLAWYGQYADVPDESVVPVVISLPGKTHTSEKSQYYYKINNYTFFEMPGKWFQYYGNNTASDETNGNLLAFKVERDVPVKFNETNVTGVISYEIIDNTSEVEKLPEPLLPEKHIADYLIARGDGLQFNTTGIGSTGLVNVWLFGRVDNIYDYHSVKSVIDINKSYIQKLETGTYSILLQSPIDNVSYFTVRYNTEKDSVEWFDPIQFDVFSMSVEGFSPQVVLDKLQGIFPQSRDTYTLQKMVLQDPSVSIMRVDEVYKNGTSVLDVRGYTNVANGTIISIVFDPDRQTPRTLRTHTYTGEAIRTSIGNMSYYRVYVPLNWDDIRPGVHTLKAFTQIGGEVFKDIVVSEMPADSYKPNATLKYIEDRNPWIPTPTPITVIKKEIQQVTVERTVVVNVTPSNEQVYTELFNVAKACLAVALIVVVIVGVGLYVRSVYVRGKKYGKKK